MNASCGSSRAFVFKIKTEFVAVGFPRQQVIFVFVNKRLISAVGRRVQFGFFVVAEAHQTDRLTVFQMLVNFDKARFSGDCLMKKFDMSFRAVADFSLEDFSLYSSSTRLPLRSLMSKSRRAFFSSEKSSLTSSVLPKRYVKPSLQSKSLNSNSSVRSSHVLSSG